MTGELAIAGVFFPTLLLLGAVAMVLTAGLTRLCAVLGLYRFIAYRPLVDLSLFILLFGVVAALASSIGMHP